MSRLPGLAGESAVSARLALRAGIARTGRSAIAFTQENRTALLALGVLAGLVLALLFQLGLTGTDDALFAMQGAELGPLEAGRITAELQGRVFYLVNYTAAAWTLGSHSGTRAGAMLQYAPVVLSMLLILTAIGQHAGRHIAFGAACVFLSTWMIRWEQDFIHAHQLYVWPWLACAATASLLFRAYLRRPRWYLLATAAPLYLLGHFLPEALTVSVVAMIAAGVLWSAIDARHAQLVPPAFLWRDRVVRNVLAVMVVLSLSYGALYGSWRLAYGSDYPGNEPAPFDPAASLSYGVRASVGSSIWFFLADHPYPQGRYNATTGSWSIGTEEPYADVSPRVLAIEPWLFGAVAAVAAFAVFGAREPRRSTRWYLGLLAFGLILALAHETVISLSNRRLDWETYGVYTNQYSSIALLGWGIVVAGLCRLGIERIALRSAAARSAAVAAIATVLGLSAIVAYGVNAELIDFHRPAGQRWRAAQLGAELFQAAGVDNVTVWAPRFMGPPVAGAPEFQEDSWEAYFRGRYGLSLTFTGDVTPPPELAADGPPLYVLDYYVPASNRRDGNVWTLLAIARHDPETHELVLDQIWLGARFPTALTQASLSLSYSTTDGSLVRLTPAAMERSGTLFSADTGNALLRTLTVSEQPQLGIPARTCPTPLPPGETAGFGSDISHRCTGDAFAAEGWNPAERGGRLAQGRLATLVVPIDPAAAGPDRAVAVTLGGRATSPGPDPVTVQVAVGGTVYAEQVYDRNGTTPPAFTITVPTSALAAANALAIELRISEPFPPGTAGSGDDEEYGFFLQWLRVD